MAFRVGFGITSLGILILCLTNFWVEWTPTWRDYQGDYHALQAAKIEQPREAQRTRNTPPEFKQIYNQELGIADRCVICHLGIDNPRMQDAPNPHKTHPGDLLLSHPFEQVGCTICHHGQGAATTVDDAHGQIRDWERPLLRGDFVQATCAKCHREDDVPQAPLLTRGRRLIRERGCTGCHQVAEIDALVKIGPPLTAIGSKVSRRWIHEWLTDPKSHLPSGMMPYYGLSPGAVRALSAYLMSYRDKAIDAMPDRKGDYDAGEAIRNDAQCVVCHVTKEDYDGKPVGGVIGPNLLKVGSKVSKQWLGAYFKNPHVFSPNTKMPRYNFDDEEALDLAQFVSEEWIDWDLPEEDQQKTEPVRDPKSRIRQGGLLFVELGCAGCHDLLEADPNPVGPELTFIGGKPLHELDFGDAEVPHTLPDYLYTKLKSPRSLTSGFRLPVGADPATALWKNLQPAALFSKSARLPDSASEQSPEDRLAWILARVQEQGALEPARSGKVQQEGRGEDRSARESPQRETQNTVVPGVQLPGGATRDQAAWLTESLNEVRLLSPLKMPDFKLTDEDAEALCITLMSFSAERVHSHRYHVPRKRKVLVDSRDAFGKLERRYRCLSCHKIRDSGDLLASDLSFEGSRVNQKWLYHYLKRPYSMRRTLTIAMPIFDFPDEEAQVLATYISQVLNDSEMGEAGFIAERATGASAEDGDSSVGWKEGQEKADADRGERTFNTRGCIACHQLHGRGGDVGPSLTSQVPEFPPGTWVGDKLRGEWIYQWLKAPHVLTPDAPIPNLELSHQEAADLTAYLLNLKSRELADEE